MNRLIQSRHDSKEGRTELLVILADEFNRAESIMAKKYRYDSCIYDNLEDLKHAFMMRLQTTASVWKRASNFSTVFSFIKTYCLLKIKVNEKQI